MLRETYPAALHPVHFALVEGDLLLSYAATFRLPIEHAGQVYEMGCLGNVFTYPGSRGRGYGRCVVGAATSHLRESGADLAALFCEPDLQGFYAASGWAPTPASPTVLTDGRGEPEAHDALRMMLFVSEEGVAGRPAFETLPLCVPFPW